ncbi:hypothetical protein P22_3995 [Propionispora sp. 2/2-37]|uniref:hypothetical protein n=1 Tax=Propionispora sp. 2/2-37 TaxID=1677858 RepID=UPI0006BB722B|nr:hypothetical protein [Propionispora sp. 2/2-37]CUH97848.1 hypothetical protein P22_3995 [Propionispora sp. 2/2-37]
MILRKFSERRPISMDVDHIKMLHTEAMEQLDLMKTAVETAQEATDIIRDNLNDMALNHWHYYLDVMHMITKHDEAMSAVLQKHGLQTPDPEQELAERQCALNYCLLRLLLVSLQRRHQRMSHVLGLYGEPMHEYVKESLTMEREHIASLVSMVQSLI